MSSVSDLTFLNRLLIHVLIPSHDASLLASRSLKLGLYHIDLTVTASFFLLFHVCCPLMCIRVSPGIERERNTRRRFLAFVFQPGFITDIFELSMWAGILKIRATKTRRSPCLSWNTYWGSLAAWELCRAECANCRLWQRGWRAGEVQKQGLF